MFIQSLSLRSTINISKNNNHELKTFLTSDGKYDIYLDGDVICGGWVNYDLALSIINEYIERFKKWDKMSIFKKYIIKSGFKCYMCNG